MSPSIWFYLSSTPTSYEETAGEKTAKQLIGPLLIGAFIDVWLFGVMMLRGSIFHFLRDIKSIN